MKENVKYFIFIVLILFTLVYLGIVVQPNQTLSQRLYQLPSGFTTLSLSKAEFTTQCPGGISSPCWVLTVSQGGLAQQAIGTIDNEKVGQMSGQKPQKDLTIQIKWEYLAWEYPIVVDYLSTHIYTYKYKTWHSGLLNTECTQLNAEKNCGKDWYVYGKFANSFECFCITKERWTSYIGYLDNCNVHSISTINLTANGETYSAKIDTKGVVSQKIGNYVYVTWNGNLIKQNCPTQSPYISFYQGGWKIGKKTLYDYYLNHYQDFERYLRQSISGGTITKAEVDTYINTVNNYASQFLAGTTFGSIINPQSTSEPRPFVEYRVSSDVQVPQYTFYVSANLLKIYQPAPSPRIVDIRASDFKSGEEGYVWARIINDGDDGNIEVFASCHSPMASLETTKTIFLKSGATTDIYFKVGANVATRTCRQCTVEARGAGTVNVDKKSIGICADPQKVCNRGTKQCSLDRKRILMCNDEESGFIQVSVCGENEFCTYEGNDVICKSNIQPGGGNGGDATKPFSLDILIPFLASLLAFLVVGRESINKRDYVGIAIAIVVGIIVWVIGHYIVANWVKIAIILGIAGILGGASLYFLGGVFIAISFVIGQIIKNLRGG